MTEREDRWGMLMQAAQGGDRSSYDRLLLEILPELRAVVTAHVADASSIDDAVQNALLSIHRARHTFQPRRPFGPWMRAIARNAAIDVLRARRVQSAREVQIDLDLLTAEPGEERGQDRPVSRLRLALESLPRAQREAVELIHLRSFSVVQAAQQVGIKPGALKVRAHRGYRALRAFLTRGDRD
jgi:RNA polymerase sigma-70 factor (ECF subfamily)